MAVFIPWFEERGPQSCLLTMVDDATGHSLGAFGGAGNDLGGGGGAAAWIEQHGVPLALYTDWKNVYVRAAEAAERATGAVPLTQFGRMCAALGIQIIPASSPQAKGRVERHHGTHQDRLVKKLRRKGIADDAAANAFLDDGVYRPEHNARFAQAPAATPDFHRRRPSAAVFDRSFGWKRHGRSGMTGWCATAIARFSWRGRVATRRRAARSLVCESPDGRIAIQYRGRPMRWTDVTGVAAAAPPAKPAPRASTATPTSARRAPREHPWHHSYKAWRPDQAEAAKRVTSLRGHFYRAKNGDISISL